MEVDMQHFTETIAFIGGGNMATAILGGLCQQGLPSQQIIVVDPGAETRARLQQQYSVHTLEMADSTLAEADVVIWAVKPQQMKGAAAAAAPHTQSALHISVAAGIGTETLTRWLCSTRIVRCMPNTPALVGKGMTGLYAMPSVTEQDCALTDTLLAHTGKRMWVQQEALIDSITAISGSGPAYVFYWMEALMQGGMELGLTQEQMHELITQTFTGAAALVQAGEDAPHVLRQRVTSKGGTTEAAIASMQNAQVAAHITEAVHACYQRAVAMGKEFV